MYHQVHHDQFAVGETTENIAESFVVQEQVIVQATPRVVDSLPPVSEFTGPVYDQVHQVQFTAGEVTKNFAKIPVVHEQVIAQDIPEVVDSLPLDEEFTGPVYDQVHQEMVASSEMAENFAGIPVVHEQAIVQDFPEVFIPLPPAEEVSAPVYGQVHQVFVGLRPERLVDARRPQRCGRTPPSVGAPVLAVQSLRGLDGVDNPAAKFLLQQALKKKEEEEEERRKREKEEKRLAVHEEAAAALERARLLLEQAGKRRKRKKRRKRRTPRTSSHSSRSRVRLPQRAVVYSWLVFYRSRCVPFFPRKAQDALLFVRYGPEGQFYYEILASRLSPWYLAVTFSACLAGGKQELDFLGDDFHEFLHSAH